MTKQMQQEPGLPADLVDRMQRLAESRTTGSRPFPAMDRAIRRDRMSRFGGVAAATAMAAVVATGVVVGGGLDGGNRTGTPAATVAAPEDVGYPAKTSGSLAGDEEWLSAMRERVIQEQEDHLRDAPITSEPDIRIVAAGDVPGQARFALVFYPTEDAQWVRQLWFGEPGAAAAAMLPNGASISPDDALGDPETLFRRAGIRQDRLQVFVSAPGAESVTILTGRTFGADGKAVEERRELPAVADGVWAGSISRGEYLLADTRADGEPIVAVTGGGEEVLEDGYDFASVAPTGSDMDALRHLSGILTHYARPSIEEKARYAATAKLGTDTRVSVGLMQAPSGAYLYGLAESIGEFADSFTTRSAGGIIPAGQEPGQLMTGMRVSHENIHHYVVLAPEGATQVRVGPVTAGVRNRLAVAQVPAAQDTGTEPLRAQAVNGQGQVIGETTPVESN